MCKIMNKRTGRCCCIFTCLSVSAGLALVFLGIFLALLGLLQSSGHTALRVSGYVLAGCGIVLLIGAGASFLWPGGRGELHNCCLQHNSSQVGAEGDDSSSCSSGDSYYEPPPQLRVIPPTPFAETERRPETAPELTINR